MGYQPICGTTLLEVASHVLCAGMPMLMQYSMPGVLKCFENIK